MYNQIISCQWMIMRNLQQILNHDGKRGKLTEVAKIQETRACVWQSIETSETCEIVEMVYNRASSKSTWFENCYYNRVVAIMVIMLRHQSTRLQFQFVKSKVDLFVCQLKWPRYFSHVLMRNSRTCRLITTIQYHKTVVKTSR